MIPGLLRLGYEPEDAADYAIAACWEFIIPRVGADVANIGALSFPKVVDRAFRGYLKECDTFDQFMMRVKKALIDQANAICDSIKDLWFVPSPFMNVMMGCDVSQGPNTTTSAFTAPASPPPPIPGGGPAVRV